MMFSSFFPGDVDRYLYRAVRGDSGGGRNSLTLGLINAVNALLSRVGVACPDESSEGGVWKRGRLGIGESSSSFSSGVSGAATLPRFVGTVVLGDLRLSIGESTFLK